MGLGTTTIKHILLLLNFVLMFLSLILISFSIFILVSGSANQTDHGENAAGGLVMTLGIVILVTAIFGFIAALRESKHKLIIYVPILVMLILTQLVMTSMASHGTRDGLSGSIRQGFEELWSSEIQTPGALAHYEDWLHCCGVNNTDDYRRIQHEIPKTCCHKHDCSQIENLYPDGCMAKFEEYLSDKTLAFSIVNCLLIIVEVISAILGWLMISKLKNEFRRTNARWL
ncbi:23 kDa integral membrane protein [Glossina fuscipes]|uniref:Tetraspanin n=2 Tax=Nemorhina TaxID=44051 RepID=A0A9C5YUU3_9MUSC|nr:23 kDa integral membrane protein [Glossina fuscipes]KAI9583483.1 hypothetical protein GQX74_005231 [Glossina fuscipes]